ncbi:hypothetical protein GALMADRAFT_144575 [Galerina marginata CBS 339.88]|uniref:Uncharacterized protein n=1 Tax=Galerina marginata (strain CBS 339.88) TaxID=685588 RepID=A0A067SSM0_GALM3|nr:hypothetical protein GALMADRAFT_144575 [Galerina marginata CBS 339.88]
MTVKPLQFQAPDASYDDYFKPEITLIAEAVSVDAISRTIVMNWYPNFTAINCSQSLTMNIYIPVMLLDMSSPSWNNQLKDLPVFQLNSTQACLGTSTTYSSFRTVTKLLTSKQYLRVQSFIGQANFQGYPFDVYLAPFSFYTQNLESKAITALKVADSFGIAVNFEISLLESIVNYNGIKDSLQFTLRLERSVGTKVFVILVGVTNWLTAIAFLTICAATIIYRPHKIFSEMFVVPVGALFAFSSIRANFPGAPAGFGATIDMYTILPVLVIMSLCSFSLLLVILYRRIQEHKTGDDEENLKKADRTSRNSMATEFSSPKILQIIPSQSLQPSIDLTDAGESTFNPTRSSLVQNALSSYHQLSGEDE